MFASKLYNMKQILKNPSDIFLHCSLSFLFFKSMNFNIFVQIIDGLLTRDLLRKR